MKAIVLLPVIAAAVWGCKDGSPGSAIPGVASSNDYKLHGPLFEIAAQTLVAERRCSPHDFKEFGGFWRSNAADRPDQYFIYCDGRTARHRIYIRVGGDKVEVLN
ncbi:hypothetical protein [Bosea sp. BIWAKO-01]|uniref:hypothetical protein n=1 Tax=Bosea sp. BIWAKO-01 TaxID=506668 RepID=UPI000853273E|nr:hypothetical protein [Bosea sp. BIWAKO-01]GAU82896.1 hypothetical protein BIWAKO_02819 [Bosea sp. BIWAKO-01]